MSSQTAVMSFNALLDNVVRFNTNTLRFNAVVYFLLPLASILVASPLVSDLVSCVL
jgi:hypothetical protein